MTDVATTLTHATYPPATITPEVLKFCERLNGQPQFLPVEPIAFEPFDDCTNHVANAVKQFGGASIYGWAVWEWPSILLEAEFHAVWQPPQCGDKYIDVSPKRDGEKRILFVADASLGCDGRRISSKRMPLRKLTEISDFIATARELETLIGEKRGAGVTEEQAIAILDAQRKLGAVQRGLMIRTPIQKVAEARRACGIE